MTKRKCSYCKSTAHTIRSCPSKAKHLSLVRECSTLFFRKLYNKMNEEGIGPYSIISIEDKPHYFYSKSREELVYEPNRSFSMVPGKATSDRLYNSEGSTNTFIVTSMTLKNAGLFGPCYGHVFGTIRNMSEKLYYDTWARAGVVEAEFDKYVATKRQKPKEMSGERYRSILYDSHKRKKFIEVQSLPLPPPAHKKMKATRRGHYEGICDFRVREMFNIKTEKLLTFSRIHQSGAKSLAKLVPDDMHEQALNGELDAMFLLEYILEGAKGELNFVEPFAELSDKVRVISRSGRKNENIEENISLSVDISEQQWYDVARSFRKRIEELVSARKRNFI